MDHWIIGTAAGAVLVAIGALFIRSHLKSWQLEKNDSTLDEKDRKYFYRRFRRRMQTSGMIALLGVLLAVGVAFVPIEKAVRFATIYWLIVLLLAFWVSLQGMADMLSTAAHSRAALARIRQKQRVLESQLQEIKRRGSNGRKQGS